VCGAGSDRCGLGECRCGPSAACPLTQTCEPPGVCTCPDGLEVCEADCIPPGSCCPLCTADQKCCGGFCISNDACCTVPGADIPTCPDGQYCCAGTCVDNQFCCVSDNPVTCPSGQHCCGTQCVSETVCCLGQRRINPCPDGKACCGTTCIAENAPCLCQSDAECPEAQCKTVTCTGGECVYGLAPDGTAPCLLFNSTTPGVCCSGICRRCCGSSVSGCTPPGVCQSVSCQSNQCVYTDINNGIKVAGCNGRICCHGGCCNHPDQVCGGGCCFPNGHFVGGGNSDACCSRFEIFGFCVPDD
jgi:hypothetical protein